MVIAEYCNYAANYAGNFIKSLQSMESYTKENDPDSQVIYILPQFAASLQWAKDLSRTNVVIFMPKYGRLKTNLKLIGYCKHYHIDILHSHFHGLSSIFLIGYFTKTKVISHFHNTIDQISFGKKILYRILGLKVSYFVGCSKAVYDTLRNIGLSLQRTTYITNCIDFSRLDNYSTSTEPFDKNKTNLLILGSDFYRKGVDATLKAIEPIQEVNNICLNIITHNTQQTQNLIKKVLGYQAEWVKIVQPTEYIGDYYRNSAIFLSPSLAEGFCYAVHEALYCKCMVIKTDIPAMTYGLCHEDFITIPSQKELKEKIESTLKMDYNYRDELILSLRNQVIKKYDVKKWGEEMYYLYKNLS